MSIPVSLERLRAALAERQPAAYVLTVSEDGSPHAVHAGVAWDGDMLVTDVGRRSAANATARPSVSLLYPLRSAEDYSLIVDGTAVVVPSEAGHRLRVTPTRAVLHRAAAAPVATDAPCQSDCVPLQRAKR
jgi:hypothetical protein